ncbi:MAG: Isochorismatase hydrolase [Candidatus Roizmanbacteria bacterium GW2011_GWA2_36_23]|uniref:Isochorismatase hydrolase n=1 Tax=Candidatus Roizmanbacteria bacterium GW2011_GWA2_36_23 TaxID=1618480 RepID=A0A0G0EL12_9BACT|nr:MAG: Isochorismatase hydrolase [Candidatus Roizmanbacteria bacterium GW2011_GWA2_36_23]
MQKILQEKKALLVLDMINVYIYGDKPLIPIETRSLIVSNIKQAIKSARKNHIPIIYVNSAFRYTDPIFVKYINYRDQAIEGSPESDNIKELQPLKGDYILKKRGYDGFWESGLEKLLKDIKITQVFLTGCQTDCCVRETAVTAAHLGYDVYILQDCCQTSREFGQIAALRFMKTCVKGFLTVDKLKW